MKVFLVSKKAEVCVSNEDGTQTWLRYNEPLTVHFAKGWAEIYIAKQPRRPNQPKNETDYVIDEVEMNPSAEEVAAANRGDFDPPSAK
jgi:hypothetical protein